MNSKDRHDFLNNSIRIEFLNKLISDAVENGSELNIDQLKDFQGFLKDQIEYLELLIQDA